MNAKSSKSHDPVSSTRCVVNSECIGRVSACDSRIMMHVNPSYIAGYLCAKHRLQYDANWSPKRVCTLPDCSEPTHDKSLINVGVHNSQLLLRHAYDNDRPPISDSLIHKNCIYQFKFPDKCAKMTQRDMIVIDVVSKMQDESLSECSADKTQKLSRREEILLSSQFKNQRRCRESAPYAGN